MAVAGFSRDRPRRPSLTLGAPRPYRADGAGRWLRRPVPLLSGDDIVLLFRQKSRLSRSRAGGGAMQSEARRMLDVDGRHLASTGFSAILLLVGTVLFRQLAARGRQPVRKRVLAHPGREPSP